MMNFFRTKISTKISNEPICKKNKQREAHTGFGKKKASENSSNRSANFLRNPNFTAVYVT